MAARTCARVMHVHTHEFTEIVSESITRHSGDRERHFNVFCPSPHSSVYPDNAIQHTSLKCEVSALVAARLGPGHMPLLPQPTSVDVCVRCASQLSRALGPRRLIAARPPQAQRRLRGHPRISIRPPSPLRPPPHSPPTKVKLSVFEAQQVVCVRREVSTWVSQSLTQHE